MKLIIILFVIFQSFILLAKEIEKKAEVVFSSAIEVSPREKITAFDLVEVENASDELLDNLKKIVITVDETSTVKKIDLIKKIKNLEAKFTLPDEIKILRSKANMSRMEIERKITNYLSIKCSTCEYSIQVNSVPAKFPNDWVLDMGVDFSKSVVNVPVYSFSDIDTKGYVVVELKKYAQVPVLNRALKIGDTITDDVLTFEKRLILPYQEILLDVKQIIGMQAVKFLTAGQTLNSRDLKKEIILKKGQVVKALYGEGNFEISILAQAEESGAVGDVIKVKNLDTNKLFAAKVVDRGIVKIE